MRVLIACEFSGRVREAFRRKGHDAWSCDLEPTEIPGNHYQQDVRSVLSYGWDLLIGHPPCTYLASSGARWWKVRQREQEEAIRFVETLWNCDIPSIAIENPVGILSKVLGMPSQVFQPWHLGAPFNKRTCLWLKGLPRLTGTSCGFADNEVRDHGQSKDRQKNRSRTYEEVAEAMARCWG